MSEREWCEKRCRWFLGWTVRCEWRHVRQFLQGDYWSWDVRVVDRWACRGLEIKKGRL